MDKQQTRTSGGAIEPDALCLPQAPSPSKLIRRSVTLPSISAKIETNLSDSELCLIVDELIAGQFFIGLPTLHIEQSRISLSPRFRNIEFRDGWVMAVLFCETLHLYYRTAEEWAAWEEEGRIQSEAKEQTRRRRDLIWSEYNDLRDSAIAAQHNGNFSLAESRLLECLQMESSHEELKGYGDAQTRLIYHYAESSQVDAGLTFIDSRSGRVQDYSIFACSFESNRDYCSAERVYRHAIGLHPKESSLYKAHALMLARANKIDDAITVCETAIQLGLTDDTKSGFHGRVERLKQSKIQPVAKKPSQSSSN